VIVPIVEGQSEERAIGGLMRRVLHDLEVFDLLVARPFRVKRQRVVRVGELERSIVQAERSRPGASSIFIVLDADADCPADLASELLNRARAQTDLRVSVVLAKIEIEAWILAAVDSLIGVRGIRDDARPPADPEAVRDAKGALTRLMTGRRGYVATDDLPALVDAIDLRLATERSPSFAKFRRDLERLAQESRA
jgi:Domain of unknown function (DUF4276)